MSFYAVFLRTLPQRPIAALIALYWNIVGKKLRAKNRLRMAIAQSPNVYQEWIASAEQQDLSPSAGSALACAADDQPHFTILISVDRAEDSWGLATSLQSIRKQSYAASDVIVVGPVDDTVLRRIEHGGIDIGPIGRADSFAAGLAAAGGDYLVPLRSGDQLNRGALFRLSDALQKESRPAVIFGDEDRIDRFGCRKQPWFKPGWNAEMFLAQDYISTACAIRCDRARSAPTIDDALAPVAPYALLLAILAQPGATIVKLDHVLINGTNRAAADLQQWRVKAVTAHLADTGASVRPGAFGNVQVAWPLPKSLPLVSLIVPTRDKVKLLKTCVDGVLDKTDYRDIELIIVDNGSVEPATRDYLDNVARDGRVRVLRDDGPYNYAAINNRAVKASRGDYLCLLNNDTEVITNEWLTELMRQAVRGHVGAAGAKLLYGDGTIQHAGVVVGLGGAAGHVHRYLRNDRPGYFAEAHIQRYSTAVTAACLVVAKAKFNAVGGFDESGLAVAFNDVDLCLKLQGAGWHNVFVPTSVLIHHESKSRGRDISPKNIERYLGELAVLQQRWNTVDYADPYYNANLTKADESHRINLDI